MELCVDCRHNYVLLRHRKTLISLYTLLTQSTTTWDNIKSSVNRYGFKTISNIKKVILSRYRPGEAQRLGRVLALLFHDRGTRMGGEWSAASPGRTLPPGKIQYPFHRRLGGPQDRSGRAENLVPTGIRSRTVQPVVSRYTDWATRLIYMYVYISKYIK